MENEKAIEILNSEIELTYLQSSGCDEDVISAYKLAIAALERQIGTEPIDNIFCPNCKSDLLDKVNFCSNCGQKIAWELQGVGMKTLYVTIPDEKLLELIDKYNNSSPVGDVDDFSVYLSLGELKRFRDTRIAEPEARALTLEELREMPIFGWAWIEIINPMDSNDSAYKRKCSDYTKGEAFCCGWPGYGFEYEYEDYGKTWLAYDRQPKGASDNA